MEQEAFFIHILHQDIVNREYEQGDRIVREMFIKVHKASRHKDAQPKYYRLEVEWDPLGADSCFLVVAVVDGPHAKDKVFFLKNDYRFLAAFLNIDQANEFKKKIDEDPNSFISGKDKFKESLIIPLRITEKEGN